MYTGYSFVVWYGSYWVGTYTKKNGFPCFSFLFVLEENRWEHMACLYCWILSFHPTNSVEALMVVMETVYTTYLCICCWRRRPSALVSKSNPVASVSSLLLDCGLSVLGLYMLCLQFISVVHVEVSTVFDVIVCCIDFVYFSVHRTTWIARLQMKVRC